MPKTKVALKKGDSVLVITGEDKGKNGKIIEMLPNQNKVIIEGVNFLKKHMKPTQKSPQGGIARQEGSIHLSNVKLVCNKCNKAFNGKDLIKEELVKAEEKLEFICKECK